MSKVMTDRDIVDATVRAFTPGASSSLLNVTREAMADRLFSDSCHELARIRDMLEPAFTRHQKALDAVAASGRECKFPGMGRLLTEAWREFVVQQQVEKERAKGR